MNAPVAGVGPNMNGVVPWRSASSSHTSSSVGVDRGLGAQAAGQVPAGPRSGRPRRRRSWPRSTSVATAASPIGPQPNTATPSPARRRPVRPRACPRRGARRTRRRPAPGRRAPGAAGRRRPARTSSSGVSPPSGPPPPMRPSSLVAGLDDHPVADPDAGDLVADPVDDAGHLVAEAQRLGTRAGHAAQADVGAGRCRRCRTRRSARPRPAARDRAGATSSTRTSPGPWTRTCSMGTPSQVGPGSGWNRNDIAHPAR